VATIRLNLFINGSLAVAKQKKVALVAAVRKILVWAWIIFSRQIDWRCRCAAWRDLHQLGA